MVSERARPSGGVLLLSADRPDPHALGGVSVHVAALAAVDGTLPVSLAYPVRGALRVESTAPRRAVADLDLTEGLDHALEVAISGTRSHVLHVHSPELGPAALVRAATHTGAVVLVTLHDHFLACENYALLEGGERFCGVPEDPARCDRCLSKTFGHSPGALSRHREQASRLVRTTARFIAPSESVLDLVSRAHPSIRSRSLRMDWGVPPPRARSSAVASGAARLSVAVVALHSAEKGRERLPELLRASAHLPVDFHVFGATEGRSSADLREAAPHVTVHGAYRREQLAPRLVGAGVHVALLPSTKPETFSLVSSEVAAAGVPIIGSDFGALGERVRRDGLGFVFDPWEPASLASLLAELARDPSRLDAVARHVRTLSVRTEADMRRDHETLWAAVADTAVPARNEALYAEFEAGRARLDEHPPSRLLGWAEAVRRTDFYRDLPLRTLLSESTRKKLFERLGARLERRRK